VDSSGNDGWDAEVFENGRDFGSQFLIFEDEKCKFCW